MSFISPLTPVCPSDLLRRARFFSTSGAPLRFALAGADTLTALEGAISIRNAGLGEITLVGDGESIRSLSREHKISLHSMSIHDCATSEISVETARLATKGEVQIVMKGSVKTDDFMRALLSKDAGLRVSGRRMVHIFYITPPSAESADADTSGGILLSDCAVNVSPDERTKQDALRYMGHLARAVGIFRPRLAILSASEQESDTIPTSLVAGSLARWGSKHLEYIADVGGPLSFDVALVAASARLKGVGGVVAGRANGLLVPEIVAGNALFKALVWVGGGCAAGIVVGGLVPIVLTSRSDKAAARLASAAFAMIAANESYEPESDYTI